jgi:hypothetical protein
MSREDEVIRVINKMISSCDPIKYADFNKIIKEKEFGILEKIETEDKEVGIRLVDMNNDSSGYCITTLTLIATITDILVGKRLSFQLDDNNYLIGVKWYK